MLFKFSGVNCIFHALYQSKYVLQAELQRHGSTKVFDWGIETNFFLTQVAKKFTNLSLSVLQKDVSLPETRRQNKLFCCIKCQKQHNFFLYFSLNEKWPDLKNNGYFKTDNSSHKSKHDIVTAAFIYIFHLLFS